VSLDLNALAARIAESLAKADRTPASVPIAPVAPTAPGSRFPVPGTGPARIADYIDHTLLKAEATAREVEQLCVEAAEHRFAAVCVNPVWVPLCADRLRGTKVGVATVIGFPLGANRSETKAFEASRAVGQGATELDMVAAVGHIKSADWGHVADDIEAVVKAAGGTLVKVIIESAALTPVEIIKASALAREAGAQYVKTSTGFHPTGGASAEAVALMRLVVGDALGVKASGGVRDCPTALKMIGSGATRIGTSSGVAMAQCLGRGPLPINELLAVQHDHTTQCTTCGLGTAPGSAGPY
jgi:deoxyribose-phosphate aldolase